MRRKMLEKIAVERALRAARAEHSAAAFPRCASPSPAPHPPYISPSADADLTPLSIPSGFSRLLSCEARLSPLSSSDGDRQNRLKAAALMAAETC